MKSTCYSVEVGNCTAAICAIKQSGSSLLILFICPVKTLGGGGVVNYYALICIKLVTSRESKKKT